MNSVSIIIPNDKAASYKVVTLFISFINLLAFGYAVIYLKSSPTGSILSIGFVISLLATIVFFLRPYNDYIKNFRIEIAFIICACIWIFSGNYLLGVLLFVFALAGLIANRKQLIHFSKQQIRYPSFPEKILLWEDVDFVLLKDDILTIEMKDNRLMQFSIDKEVAAEIDTAEFNQYCKERVGGE